MADKIPLNIHLASFGILRTNLPQIYICMSNAFSVTSMLEVHVTTGAWSFVHQTYWKCPNIKTMKQFLAKWLTVSFEFWHYDLFTDRTSSSCDVTSEIRPGLRDKRKPQKTVRKNHNRSKQTRLLIEALFLFIPLIMHCFPIKRLNTHDSFIAFFVQHDC